MQLTELAVQNIRGFPVTARLPLKGGLTAFVSRDVDIIELLRVVLFPDPIDVEQWGGGATPRKIALTFQGRDAQTYRLVRDLDGGRSLLRSDPATKQAVKMSDDPVEIARLLSDTVGVPDEPIFRTHLAISAADLPSRVATRKKPGDSVQTTATSSVQDVTSITIDEARKRLPDLRLELERAQRFEKAQDGVYELQQRRAELAVQNESVTALEKDLAQLDQQLRAYDRITAVAAGLENKIKRFPEAVQRHDASLKDIDRRRTELNAALETAPTTADLTKDPIFGGGAVASLALFIAGFVTGHWMPWAANLLALAVAGFGAWKWVDRVEESESDQSRLKDLEERLRAVQKQFEQETGPVYAAMKALEAANPGELLQRLQDRDMVDARRVALARDIALKKADPAILAIETERQRVETDLKEREAFIHGLGFTRDQGAIRREIQAAEAALLGASQADDSDAVSASIARASELLRIEPRVLVESFRDRLGQYFGALTDKRFVGLKPGGASGFHLVAANGASGPFPSLPFPDQDAAWIALRVALAERAAASLKLPVLVDEPSLVIDGPHRGLLVKMLKTLGTQTQVIVRAFDAPPPGVVDQVVRPG